VTVADDGGSTGRIRELIHIPAMGDIRNVMLALGEDDLLTRLMDYRFIGEENIDFLGHNLGNLILTAASSISGSFTGAIDSLSKAVNVKGHIYPSSLEYITLYARMDDGTIVKGEANIPSFNQHILEVFYDHDVKANVNACDAILNADLIIYGIGSLYTSIAPNTIIPGIKEALSKTKAKRVYIANCMTQSNETYNYDLKDHIDALEKHGAIIDLVIKHNDLIPQNILDKYKATNSIEVINNKNVNVPVIEKELLDFSKGVVRHSSEKIKEVVEELLK